MDKRYQQEVWGREAIDLALFYNPNLTNEQTAAIFYFLINMEIECGTMERFTVLVEPLLLNKHNAEVWADRVLELSSAPWKHG